MTSIKNALDIILKGKVGKACNDQHKFLSIAERNSDRLAGLINDLLLPCRQIGLMNTVTIDSE